MSNPAAALAAELDQEAAATRRLLERVPEDKLAWKPHAKSMSLGQLAIHVASIPGGVSRMARKEGHDVSTSNFQPPQPKDAAEVLTTFESALADAKSFLMGLDEEAARSSWRLSHGDREILTMPRENMLRTILFNHWYHHRGQLTVYLRLLDVPLPVTYGRSADENPFEGRA